MSKTEEVTPPVRARGSEDPPRIDERYRLEKEIGRGGMGRVFVAHDRKLGRDVAIKMLAAGLHGEEALRRFEQEARATCALNHSNILDVHDVGTYEGNPYIVSELLHGSTLRERLRKGPLSVQEASGYALQLAQGLSAAHEKGIVHRDLKPENLFITEEGRLKILDFGIAKLVAPSRPETGETLPSPQLHTEAGAILGTVGYMSPEQVRGQPADQRSDVFSFGAIVYEMLAGRSPFERDTAVETGYAILNDTPPPLPAGLPPEFQRIVRRCLAKDPCERFRSAKDLAFDLATLSSSRRVSLKWLTPALALLAALLLARFWPRPAPQQRLTIAVADFVNETGDADLSGLSGMLITSLEQSHRLAVLTRSRMFDILKVLGKANAERIDEALGREICQRASAHALVLASIRRFGELYAIDLKVLDPSRDEYLFTAKAEGKSKESVPGMIDRLSEETRAGLHEQAAEIRAARVPVSQITTTNLEAYGHYYRGDQLYALGDYLHAESVAEGEFRQAIALDPQFALAHFGLGMVLDSTFRLPLEEFETALRLGERLPERERCLARALVEGPRASREAEVARQKECASRFPDDKLIELYGGDRSYHRGDLAVALPYLERALALDPTFAMTAEHLSTALQTLGQGQKQMAVAKKFAEYAHTPLAENLVAFAQEVIGESEQAAQTLRRAAESFPRSAEPWLQIATSMLFRGDADAAEAELRPLLRRPQLEGQRNTISQALIRVDVFRGRYRAAIAALGEAADAALAAGERHEAAQRLYWRAIVQAAGPGDTLAARDTVARLRSLEPNFDYFLVLADLDDAQGAESLGYVNDQFSDLLISALRARLSGRVAEAMAGYERLANAPYIGDQIRFTLARLQLEAGKPREAIATLKRLQSTYPGVRVIYWDPELWFPRSYYLIGLAHERAGDAPAALASYQRFLSLWKDADPELKELQYAKARVTTLRTLVSK